MSMTEVLTVPVSGGKAEAAKLWPECGDLGAWTDAGEPARWMICGSSAITVHTTYWVTQGVGEGLPILVPMADDPRSDRFLMDQLVGHWIKDSGGYGSDEWRNDSQDG